MRKIILGVYDRYADACSAQRALGEAGVEQADIAIYSMSADVPVEKGPRVYAPGGGDVHHHKPVFDQLEQLFARIFRRGEYPPETEDYREFIRRGGTVVSADVVETQVDLAREAMRRAGAADIGERANAWRNGSAEKGMSEHAPDPGSPAARDSSSQYESATRRQDDAMSGSGRVAGTAPSLDEMEKPVTSRDTSPDSALPAEFASDASAAAGTETPSTASPSSGPNMVGGMQQVTTHTEERRSEPSMEQRQQLSGVPDVGFARTSAGVDADLKSRAAAPSDSSAGTAGAKAQQTSGTGLVGDPVMGTPLDDDPYDDEFRKDYDAHYANTGGSYDEYRRAYTHGATLGQDERYRMQDWQQVEPSAREHWESRYPESGWERFKAAVRHGWERVTGH
ncbi:hypothetical protein [Paraburkholderia diazotrophica]|uniref:Heat induced stress protein YflT n=1 Tax=Paraburkholderia diazotrophica TaxID=667676 RepID=A0A1H6WCM2_9BURK|nr:hypothetical protein [Paraburkholderia diazotrophica]SEJ14633.1 hypothetical protein SAMN05192539_100758 [Paraburkholderia diazotrophica]